jgi:hypothetical protein
MYFRQMIAATALGLLLATQAHARPEMPSCPGLDKNGDRLPLTPGPVSQATSASEDTQPIPDDLANAARKAIGFFESGGGDPYANISRLDTISIGFLQWNWGTGSLITDFVASLKDSDIALAPQPLRSDLETLKNYQRRGERERAAAAAVVGKWTSGSSGDPLVKGARKSVREQLSAWLAQPAIRAVQDGLIEPKLRIAYSYARKWQLDTADIGGAKGDLKETTTSFFDLLTYNSGRVGLWVPHVRSFRSQFASNREIVDFIADWTISCEDVIKPIVKPHQTATKLYNTDEASANAKKWKAAVAANPGAFTDNQTNLLIFGFLRALRSIGDNAPVGFPGIYQTDVMLRRGAVALSVGTIRGLPVGSALK